MAVTSSSNEGKTTLADALAVLDAADKEVLGSQESNKDTDFANLFKSSTNQDLKSGDVVTGKVISLERDFALVDVNFKSEGLISLSEFRTVNGSKYSQCW